MFSGDQITPMSESLTPAIHHAPMYVVLIRKRLHAPCVQVRHPSRSQYVFLGLGAGNSGLPMQIPSKHRTSTETNRCLAKGCFGTFSVL